MIITMANQKGGAGKTTLTLNLAHYFCHFYGQNILVVDSDIQQSAMDWSQVREGELPFEVSGMVKKTIHRDLPKTAKKYAVTLVDCPPRTTDIVRSAMMAADLIIIPVTPSPYDIWASHETVELAREAQIYKENLKYCFVINRKIANSVICKEAEEELKKLNVPICESQISQRVLFAESASDGKTVFDFDPNKASSEMINFGEEVLKKWLKR